MIPSLLPILLHTQCYTTAATTPQLPPSTFPPGEAKIEQKRTLRWFQRTQPTCVSCSNRPLELHGQGWAEQDSMVFSLAARVHTTNGHQDFRVRSSPGLHDTRLNLLLFRVLFRATFSITAVSEILLPTSGAHGHIVLTSSISIRPTALFPSSSPCRSQSAGCSYSLAKADFGDCRRCAALSRAFSESHVSRHMYRCK